MSQRTFDFATPRRTAESLPDKARYVVEQARAQGTQGHHCHAEGCDVKVAPSMLFCKKHWAMCPKPQQQKIWATYRKGQEITKTPSREYLAAAKAAIEAVARIEGRR